MDYQMSIRNLLKEAKEGANYKQVAKGYRTLVKISLFPLILLEIALICCYYLQLFFYNALMSPVSYLEDWVDSKKNDVQHATQAVLFFVSIPFIFFLRVLLSLMSFSFFFLWFAMMSITYLVTLGSVKWQPCINLVEFSLDKNTRIKTEIMEKFIITAFIGFVLFLVVFFLFSVCGVYQLASSFSIIATVYITIIVPVNAIMCATAQKEVEKTVAVATDGEGSVIEKPANVNEKNRSNYFANFVFASLIWGAVGLSMFIFALINNGIDMFSAVHVAGNGLAFMSIILMFFCCIMGVLTILSTNKILVVNAKTLIAAILVGTCFICSTFGVIQYVRYLVNDTISTQDYITKTEAINIAKNSKTVEQEIQAACYEYYYTPSYTSTNALENSSGDWVVTLNGFINYTYFTATVTVDATGDITDVSVS